MSSRVFQTRSEDAFEVAAPVEAKRIALVLAVSLVVVAPIFLFGIPSNRDLSNHFRFALPFYDAITSGNFYPSWLAESNGGYGDPSFRFYPPALYYLLGATRFVVGDWYIATQLTFAFVSILSGLGIYFWSKTVLPSRTAAWVSVFYALAPYHLNQLYQATLLAEWAGSAVLPFVFGFVERVCEHKRRRDVAGLAFTYALLVLTHLPLTVIGSVGLGVYALVRVRKSDRFTTLTKLAAGAFLGLCASASYWVSMFSELRWIGINNVDYDQSVDYRFNFLLSTFSPDNLNVWWMNIVLLMTALLFAPAFLLIRRRKLFEERLNTGVVALTLLALFMSVVISRPVWHLLSPLQQTQFPWRWLAILSMGGSILAAAGATSLTNSNQRVKRLVIIGAMAIAVAFTLSHVVREAQYLSRPQFQEALTSVRGTASVNYWFPVWASNTPKNMTTEADAGSRAVTVNSWQPEHRNFSVAAGNETEVRVKTFYYPHWTATSDGQALQTRPDGDGALLVTIPSDATDVDLQFREPLKSRVSSIASVAGFILIGGLAAPSFRRRRR